MQLLFLIWKAIKLLKEDEGSECKKFFEIDWEIYLNDARYAKYMIK